MEKHYTASFQDGMKNVAIGKPESPFDRLSSALKALADAQARLQSLTDTLTGPQPTAVDSATDVRGYSSGGLLEHIDRATNSIRETVEDIMRNIHRIEQRL